jgi:hypothetical protein
MRAWLRAVFHHRAPKGGHLPEADSYRLAAPFGDPGPVPLEVATVRLRQVLSGVLLFKADVAEPFEHAQFFEDLLRGQRRHEREEFRPAAVRGELQETQKFRVRVLHAISAEGVGQGKGRQEGRLLARELRHVTRTEPLRPGPARRISMPL